MFATGALFFILISTCIIMLESMDSRKSNLTFKLRLLSQERCDDVRDDPDDDVSNLIFSIEGVSVWVSVQKVDVMNPYAKVRQVASLRGSDLDLVIFNAKLDFSPELHKTFLNASVSYIIADKITIIEDQPFLDGHVDTCPTLPLGDTGCTQDSNATFLYQDGSFVTNVIRSIFFHLNWTETLIIYEQEFDLEIDNVLSELSVLNVLSLLLRLGASWTEQTTEVIKEHVERIMKNGGNITLLCRRYCSSIINKNFKAIPENPYLRGSIHLSRWIVIHINDFEPRVKTHHVLFDNIAIVSLQMASIRNKQNYHVALEQTLYEAIIETGESESLVQSGATGNASWKQNLINNLQNIIARSSLPPCTWYQIQTLMWVNGSKRALSSVGQIRLSGELRLHSNIFPNTEFGFNGHRFVVSSLEWDPLVTRVNGSVTKGICMDILQQVSRNLNFTCKVIKPPDGEWGRRLPNGSFTGMIGQLERYEVDLVAAPLSVTSSRELVVDFIYPFYNEETRLLHRKPQKSDRNWRRYIGPFHPYVFVCLGISLLLASYLTSVFEGTFPQYRNALDRHEDDGLHKVSNAFWYLLGALLVQGSVHRAESITGRMFLGSWWFFSITMIGIYSGSLIAFLTVSKDLHDFKTIRELLELEDYKWGFVDGTAWTDLFQETTVQERVEFWNKVKYFNQTDPSVLSKQSNIHLNKVLEGKYAFLADNTFLQQIMRDHCQLAISEEFIFPTQYSFALPNNSLFVKLFSKYMIKIQESGLIEHWENKLLKGQRHCDFKLFNGMEPIGVSDVQSAILVICAGLVLALCTFLIECCIRMYQLRRTKKKLRMTHKSTSI